MELKGETLGPFLKNLFLVIVLTKGRARELMIPVDTEIKTLQREELEIIIKDKMPELES